MSFEILNRWTSATIYKSETADSIAAAVLEAIAANADLSGANLSGADLSDANLRGANLRGANLRGADLSDANLRGANLRDANLSDADLSDANLSDADLSGANLSDANLSDADLSGAKNFVMQIQGSRHQIVVIDEDVRIGCQRYPLSIWLDNFKSVGSENGYTDDQIEEYGDHLLHVKKCLDRWNARKA